MVELVGLTLSLGVGHGVDGNEVDAGDQQRAAEHRQSGEELTHDHARDGDGSGQEQLLGAELPLLGEEAHGEQGDQDAHGKHHDGEVGGGAVAGGDDGGVAADESRQTQKRTRIDVPDGVDEEGAELLFVDSKHNVFLYPVRFVYGRGITRRPRRPERNFPPASCRPQPPDPRPPGPPERCGAWP